MRTWVVIFGGAGIGILVGVLMGISITPTVGVIISALSSLLAVLLGLNDTHFTEGKSLRIGSFGVACVCGILFGIYTRTHNLLSEDLMSQKQEYISLGFSEEESLSFIRLKAFGIWEGQVVSAPTPESKPDSSVVELHENELVATHKETIPQSLLIEHVRSNASMLMSSQAVKIESCTNYDLDMPTDLPVKEILNNFEAAGGIWIKVARQIKHVDKSKQRFFLATTRDLICGLKLSKLELKETPEIEVINKKTSLKKLQKSIKNNKGNASVIVSKVSDLNLSEEDQKTLLFIFVQVIM